MSDSMKPPAQPMMGMPGAGPDQRMRQAMVAQLQKGMGQPVNALSGGLMGIANGLTLQQPGAKAGGGMAGLDGLLGSLFGGGAKG